MKRAALRSATETATTWSWWPTWPARRDIKLITVTCQECGHKQKLERRRAWPITKAFHIICHECEARLRVGGDG